MSDDDFLEGAAEACAKAGRHVWSVGPMSFCWCCGVSAEDEDETDWDGEDTPGGGDDDDEW